jgi:hypothetical protein
MTSFGRASESLQFTIGFVLSDASTSPVPAHNRYSLPLGSFRQGHPLRLAWPVIVTDYHWVRFVRGLSVPGLARNRYRLPLASFGHGADVDPAYHWVRFAGRRSRYSLPLGSFCRGAGVDPACHWVRFAGWRNRYSLPLGSFCREIGFVSPPRAWTSGRCGRSHAARPSEARWVRRCWTRRRVGPESSGARRLGIDPKTCARIGLERVGICGNVHGRLRNKPRSSVR